MLERDALQIALAPLVWCRLVFLRCAVRLTLRTLVGWAQLRSPLAHRCCTGSDSNHNSILAPNAHKAFRKDLTLVDSLVSDPGDSKRCH